MPLASPDPALPTRGERWAAAKRKAKQGKQIDLPADDVEAARMIIRETMRGTIGSEKERVLCALRICEDPSLWTEVALEAEIKRLLAEVDRRAAK